MNDYQVFQWHPTRAYLITKWSSLYRPWNSSGDKVEFTGFDHGLLTPLHRATIRDVKHNRGEGVWVGEATSLNQYICYGGSLVARVGGRGLASYSVIHHTLAAHQHTVIISSCWQLSSLGLDSDRTMIWNPPASLAIIRRGLRGWAGIATCQGCCNRGGQITTRIIIP